MQLAKRDGAALQLVTVWQPMPSLADTDWLQELEMWEEKRRSEHRRSLGEVARRAREALGRTVSVKVLLGRPADELAKLTAESEADLIVMATHCHGAVSCLWLGSVADRIVGKGTVPVLLIRPQESMPEVEPGPSRPFRKILIPLDGSTLAEEALKKTLLVGSAVQQAELTLLTVV